MLMFIFFVITQLKMTPLHWAVERDHIAIVKYLIKHGAALDCVNKVSMLYTSCTYLMRHSNLCAGILSNGGVSTILELQFQFCAIIGTL